MTTPSPHVSIYTDGACTGNPGPGGYGVVMLFGDKRKELSDGYRLTTNNRMEMMAAIAGLESLKKPCQVTLYSDSQYVVNAMTQGWAERWRANGWRKKAKGTEMAKNPDLWARLMKAAEQHQVKWQWVRGHAGNVENERCDELSVAAAGRADLPADEAYEKENVRQQDADEEFFLND